MGYRQGVRETRHIARRLPWAALLLATLALVLPLSSGDWDPPWLRVAQRPTHQVGPETSLEVPDVPARFAARGPAGTDGTWTLTGERVVPVDPPLVHDLVEPRLVLRRGGDVAGELSAALGRVRLPGGGSDGSAVRVDLEGDVRLVQGDVTAVTSNLTVWLHRQRFDPATGGVRVSAPGPVTLRLGGQELEAAGLDAALVPLRLDLRGPVALKALKAADPPAAGARAAAPARGPLAARALSGQAGRARLEGAPASAPRGTAADQAAAVPERLTLHLDDVDLRAAPPHDEALACDALRLVFVRAPAAARAALGGLAGLSATPQLRAGAGTYALEEVAAHGRVRARARQGDGPALTIEADTVVERPAARRLHAVGRPARVEDPTRGWLEAPTIALTREPAAVGIAIRLEAAAAAPDEVRFAFAQPTRGPAPPVAPPAAPPVAQWTGRAQRVEVRLRPEQAGSPGAPDDLPLARLDLLALTGAPGRDVVLERDDGVSRVEAQALRWDGAWLLAEGLPAKARLGPALTGEAPWRVQAERLRVRLDPASLRDRDSRDDDDEAGALGRAMAAVAALSAAGQVELHRDDAARPRRALALAGERLEWSRRRARLDLAGAPAAVTFGEATLRAPTATYDLETGALEAAGPCALDVQPTRGGAGVTVHAARAAGRLDPRPAAWTAATRARRDARRAGAGLVVPATLRELTLEGDGLTRVRVVGQGGLAAAADRVTWDAAANRATLEARPGAPPCRVASAEGALEAARVDVWPSSSPGRGRALVLASSPDGGRARLRGWLPGAEAPVELSSEWVAVEVWEPARTDERREARATPDGAPGGAPDGAPPSRAATRAQRRATPDRALAERGPAPFGLLVAGGAGGVEVDGVLAGDGAAGAPLRMRAARLQGDGAAETLRLDGAPGRPVLLARGELELEAPRARLALVRAREALRVDLDGPWRCSLPATGGGGARPDAPPGRASGGGALTAVLDAGGGRPSGGAPKDPAALLRSLLELEGAGGFEVVTPAVRARADAVSLGRPGELVLRGDPVEVSRGALRSRGLEQVLRVDELTRPR